MGNIRQCTNSDYGSCLRPEINARYFFIFDMHFRLSFILYINTAMLRTAFIALLACFCIQAAAQWKVSGKISDSESLAGLDNVVISVGRKTSVISDTSGFFFVNIPLTDQAEFRFNRAGYAELRMTIIRNDSTETRLHVVMEKKSEILPEVRISAAPNVVWGDKQLNVADFAFYGDYLMLLTYEKEDRWKKQADQHKTLYKGCHLVLCNSDQREAGRFTLTMPATGFYTDYPGQVFLESEAACYGIKIDGDEIRLEEIERSEFDKMYRTVIDTLPQKVLFSDYTASYPAFDFMMYNRSDSLLTKFHHVEDKEDMVMFRSEYKFLGPREKLQAFKLELETGIEKEIIGAYISGYPNSIYYEAANARLFADDEKLYVFDHQSDILVHYDHSGNPLDSASISYHQIKKPERWSEKLIRDSRSGKIYTWTDRNGFIHLFEIDTRSGETRDCGKLTYRYASEIRIHDGEVYYIYRPFESPQNRYLYKEKISVSSF